MPRTQVPEVELDYIYQSRPYTIGLQLSDETGPIDVSTSTFRSQLRRYPSSSTVAAEFAVDMTDAATGLVVLTLTSGQTAADVLASGPYRWDVDKIDGGVPVALAKAEMIVEAEVTR